MKAKHSTIIWLALLIPWIFASGCAAPQTRIVTEYKTVEVFKDRYVPVDESLTKPVELIDLPDDYLKMSDGDAALATGVAYSLQRTRAEQCNGQLAEIANLGKSNP